MSGAAVEIQAPAGREAGTAPSFRVRVLRFRSQEDLSVLPDPAVCAAAPFRPNVRLGATLWAEPGEGDEPWPIGTATACARIADPALPPGSRLPFWAVFDLPEGRLTASGDCTVASNDVPVPGLVLAACHLRVVNAPPGIAGGLAISASVFNPRGIEGFATGSDWTVRLYEVG